MKLQTTILTAAYLIATSVWTCPATAQNIAWKFAANDTFNVTFNQESNVTTVYNLIKRKIGTQVKLDMDWTVTAVAADGTATIQQSINDISMVMTTPTQGGVKTIEIDSTKTSGSDAPKVERDMWKQIQPLIGATFDVEMQVNGQINSVNASDATMETIRNANGSMRLRQLLTPEGLTQLFGQSLMQIPDDTSKPWEVQRTPQTDAGSFDSTQTFTLEGETEVDEQTLLRISTATKTTQSDDQKGKNELVDAAGTGELFFDAKAGYFTSSSFTNEFTFTQPYRDSVINTVTISTVTMKIEKQ